MAKLKDFISAMQNDIILARAASDLETVEIAKMYAADKYLNTLDISVPRMKVKNVDVEVGGFIKLDDLETEKESQPIASADLIKKATSIAESKLSKTEVDREVLKKALVQTEEGVLKYAKRYISQEISLADRISKISNQYVKNFEKNVLVVTKENRAVLDDLYQNLETDLIKFTSESMKKKAQALDFGFKSQDVDESYHPVTFKFALVEDDLIWEIDKEQLNEASSE